MEILERWREGRRDRVREEGAKEFSLVFILFCEVSLFLSSCIIFFVFIYIYMYFLFFCDKVYVFFLVCIFYTKIACLLL